MSPRVQFEEEADAEYRLAGRWYEAHRENLGVEFFDAVDDTIERILEYLETDAHLRILAIAHDRRKPGYWKTRLK